jgi:hypothetical protein
MSGVPLSSPALAFRTVHFAVAVTLIAFATPPDKRMSKALQERRRRFGNRAPTGKRRVAFLEQAARQLSQAANEERCLARGHQIIHIAAQTVCSGGSCADVPALWMTAGSRYQAVRSADRPVLYPFNDSDDMMQCKIIRWLWVRGSSVQATPSARRLSLSWYALLALPSRTPRGLPMLVWHGDFCHTMRAGHGDFCYGVNATFLQDVLTACKSDSAMQEHHNRDGG